MRHTTSLKCFSMNIPVGSCLFLFVAYSAAAFFAICLFSQMAIAGPSIQASNGHRYMPYNHALFCSKTTQAALLACFHEINDDYWIAAGNCNNVSGAGERAECMTEAREEQRDGREECHAQRVERTDICESIGEAAYDPEIDPEKFVDPTEIGNTIAMNPYFPLKPGMTWKYENDSETIMVTVTDETKEILGVTCAVIHDVVMEDGEKVEDTKDWYAQDIYGNVWYFGEISQEFEDGELIGTEGSWKAGEDGAKAGIIMKAVPMVGDVYRQEFALGDAEDMGEVLSLTGSAVVPAAMCNGNCLVTRDFTPLEPGVEENKYYAPGIGPILELNPESGERVELVEFVD